MFSLSTRRCNEWKNLQMKNFKFFDFICNLSYVFVSSSAALNIGRRLSQKR